MTKQNQVIVFVVLLVVLVAIWAYYFFVLRPLPVVQIPSILKVEEKEIVPPPATGNIDDAVDAFIKEISDEESVLKTEEGDTGLITTDSQEIGDFGQSIQENEF